LKGQLDPGTEEGVTQSFVKKACEEKTIALWLQVINATQLVPGLRFTTELLRQGLPLLVVATQVDVVEAEGSRLDVEALHNALGVLVLAVNARDASARSEVFVAIEKSLQKEDKLFATGWSPEVLTDQVVTDVEQVALTPSVQKRRSRTAQFDA